MSKHKGTIFLILFFAIGIGSFIFFYNSLWLIVNIVASFFIAASTSYGIVFTFFPDEKKQLAGSISLLILSSVVAFMLYDFHEGVNKKQKEIAHKEYIKQLEIKQEAEEEKKINEKLLSSNEGFIIIGKASNTSYLTSRAKSALRSVAHDPDSVKDVTALTESIKIRIKAYPTCRYAINVSYRAKNALGVYVKETACLLFDKNAYPIKVLPNSLF